MKPSVPAIPIPPPPRDFRLADWFVERIHIQLRQFKETLESDEYIQTYTILGSGERMWPRWVGFHNPNMLRIYGVDDAGVETRLFTHQSNVQFVLKKRRQEKDEEDQARKIGFQTEDGEHSI